jgi:putative Holliday junction resolvase
MRLLGIDFGAKFIGLAITDPSGILARPFKTLKNSPDAISEIKQICEEEEITTVVLGLPKSLDGTIQEQGKIVMDFKKKLEKKLTMPIVLEDERLTSRLAENILRGDQQSSQTTKKLVNELSAQLILESYLRRTKNE